MLGSMLPACPPATGGDAGHRTEVFCCHMGRDRAAQDVDPQL